MNLTFEAIASDGARVRDCLEAVSVKEGIDSLRKRGLMVIRIEPDASRQPADRTATQADSDSARVKLPVKQLMLITRQLAMLLKSGSALVPAIVSVSRQMCRPEHRRMLEIIREDLEAGRPLTESLRRFPRCFDVAYCAVVAAGESSATLPEMFERLAGSVGKRRSMQNRIIGALIYPALLIMLSANIMAVMLFFVVPRFAVMFENLSVELPRSTKFMLAASSMMQSYWYVAVLVIAAAVSGAIYLVRSPRGLQWASNMQTRVFILGRLMSRLIQAKTFRILGTLLEARVGLLDALELARGVTRNRQFQDLYERIDEAVTNGESVSGVLEGTSLINPAIVQAIRTGEQSGRLGEAITFAADVVDEENTELLNTLTRLVEPVILIVMGLVVGTVAVSLFMPLFDMTAAV